MMEPMPAPEAATAAFIEASPAHPSTTSSAAAAAAAMNTAATATIESNTNATATAAVATGGVEDDRNLLRELPAVPATRAATATAEATTAQATAATPPLAPSFLLNSDNQHHPHHPHGGRSYPVARSIVTLVRGAVDHLTDHFHDQLHLESSTSLAGAATAEATQATTASGEFGGRDQEAPIECLSIRSEGDVGQVPTAAFDSVRSVPARNHYQHHHHHTQQQQVPMGPPHHLQQQLYQHHNPQRQDHISAEEMMDDQTADFVLIDGDLVALPPAYPPNEEERLGLEEYQRDQDFILAKSCQPKPVRRGVRGLRKWIKRKVVGKSDKDKASQSTSVSSSGATGVSADLNSNTNMNSIRPSVGASTAGSSHFLDESLVASTATTTNTTSTGHSPNVLPALDPFLEPNLAGTASVGKKSAPVSKKSPRGKSPTRGWKLKRDKSGRDGTSSKEDSKKKKKIKSWRLKDAKKELTEEKQQPQKLQPTQQKQQTVQDSSSLPPAAAAAAYFPPAAAAAAYPPAAAAAAAPAVLLRQNEQMLQFQQQQQQEMMQQSLHLPFYDQQLQQQPSQAAYAYDALGAQSPPPSGLPLMSGPPTHQDSVHASFVGNVDVVEAGVLEAATCAEAYIEHAAYWDDKKEEPVYSVLPPNADYKVDKADAPDVDYMLRRAETSWNERDEDDAVDDFDPLAPPSTHLSEVQPLPGKSTGMSCPLSTAKVTDQLVHNNVLKVLMVGAPNGDKSALARAIRQSNKKPKRRLTLGVDVHSWTPDMGPESVKFSIWDVQGSSREDASADFGADPGIQSLFFSSNSLYMLVWDLAADNMKTYGQDLLLKHLDREDEESDDDDDDEEEDNAFLLEEAKRQADLALQADIEKRVLSWIDCIARRGPGSSIFPVAVIPEKMHTLEAKRRCDLMQNMLEKHIMRYQGDSSAPRLLVGMDTIMCVGLETGEGINKLQETLIAIAADDTVFDHVGTPVAHETVVVLDTIRRLKQEHKLVLVDHLMAELGKYTLSYEAVTRALHFLSSIGELLYFGKDHDEILSQYIILSRKWFVSALSCILRNDLKRELCETRRFMNMQCIYSNHQFPENPVILSLTDGSASSCPLLSSSDTNMLWLSMQFMREAANQSSELNESSTTASNMFRFLETLLVDTGVFLPLQVSHSMDDPEVYFVPCLMEKATDNNDVWTFKSSEGWMTTLCHSYLFRDGAPSDLMEHITVGLVRDLHLFSRTFPSGGDKTPPHRCNTYPLVRSGADDFLRAHEDSAVGRMKIHQIMCWQSAFLVKIGCIFADTDTGDLKESFVEIFVTLVDMSSSHCVASDAMRATMQRLILSGKGQAGNHGTKLWKGGFEVVLKSVQTTLGNFSNIDRQVVCPECLSHSQPRYACTWGYDSVKAAAESGSSIVRCMRGHRVDANLICGTAKRQDQSTGNDTHGRSVKPVPELLNSVVLVGLWDANTREIRNVGSGFIADKRLGLVVTAGHVLFDMEEGRSFGAPYFGIENAKVVIGVIPEGGHSAVYRYFADILADDIQSVDACVVRLTARLSEDIDGDLVQQEEAAFANTPLNLEAIQSEHLRSLKTTTRYELEESVRILGFNQGGEGLIEQGTHVNRSADFAKGYIVKKFVAPAPMSDDDSSHSSGISTSQFVPREEVVVICPTIAGHSGGPCVNNDGKVVGILSRADPGERQRCYLVPASEIKELVKKAKRHFTRPSMLLTPRP